MQGLLVVINQLKKTIMKPVFKLLSFALLASIFTTSCSKTADAPLASTDSASTQSAKIAAGTWVISSYTQKTENKSSMFAGTVFTFQDAGKLTATQNGNVISGTWSYSPSSVGYYGSAPTKASIRIALVAGSPFTNLNKTWNVVSSDNSTLSLINPEPKDDERLSFSKQ